MENESCDNVAVILGLFQMFKTCHNTHSSLINQFEVQLRRKEVLRKRAHGHRQQCSDWGGEEVIRELNSNRKK